MAETVDVLVIGAGPAGSTIARLLASWGYSVRLLEGPPAASPAVETLPPEIDIPDADFYPNHGTTCWWGGDAPHITNVNEGWHADRRQFESLLLSLAVSAGAAVHRNRRAPRVALETGVVEHDGGVSTARFIIDASGRAGLLARQIKRFWDQRYRSIALCAMVTAPTPWNADPHHTLMEAYETGWAWSVPLAPCRRQVSFMVDAASAGGGPAKSWRTELGRTNRFRELFADSTLEAEPWIRDANPYYSERYAGANWMLAGEAASFVDPLGFSGSARNLASAAAGAAVVNTCLKSPDLAGAAIRLYNERQSGAWLDDSRRAARRYARGAALFNTAFWRDRAVPPGDDLDGAFERMQLARQLCVALAEPARDEPCPEIRGREVVLVNRAVLPALRGTGSLEGVDLVTLAQLAPGFETVSALHEAYMNRLGTTPLAAVRAALVLLIAKGALRFK